MAGYIIGIVLGIIVFLMQNLKPVTIGFRVSFFLLSIVFVWGIGKTDIGYWNLLVIPLGEMVLCFISAVLFPYHAPTARFEYDYINGDDYYLHLQKKDKIGRIDAPGFKQTYDRIIAGLLWDLTHNNAEHQELIRLLYSKNFYPISEHTKQEVINHILESIGAVVKPSVFELLSEEQIRPIFNAYVSVMSIHEEATRGIEEKNNSRHSTVTRNK